MNEQLKQAVWELTNKIFPTITTAQEFAVKTALESLSTPSILRHADPEIMKQAGWVSITDAQRAMTEYYKTEGCGCCGDYEGHKDATNKIGELLNFTPYSDGSGYDLSTPKQ